MAHLSDLPIRIRIFLAFGLVMPVTLGLGSFALWQLRTINDAADTSESIGGVIGTIAEVDQISASIAVSIEQQGASTSEISRNIAQTATGVGEMSGNVDQVKDATAHAGAAAGQVLSAAHELSQQSEVLKCDVERFLLAIRAV